MADPYVVLGLHREATPTEAEASYHRLLFEWHPDRHQAQGPEAVAQAETRTRELNEAIDRIRRGWRPDPVADRPSAARVPPPPDHGEQMREHAPVPCPLCDEPMTSLAAFEAHLHQAHGRVHTPHPRPTRPRRRLSTLRFGLANLVVVVVMIVSVAALGGSDATIDRLHGTTPAAVNASAQPDPSGCDAGLTGLRSRPTGCSDRGWPEAYFLIGMAPTFFLFIYRTTTKR